MHVAFAVQGFIRAVSEITTDLIHPEPIGRRCDPIAVLFSHSDDQGLDLMPLAKGETVDESLFNLTDCGYEVRSFFDGQKFTQKDNQ
jgi:hypothetical protein